MAGSIRRQRHQVKDIEIVCQPKRELKKDPSILFDEGKIAISPDFVHALATITDAVIRGNPEGRYMQIKTTSKKCPGIYLDLFMPQPEDYFRQLTIRTGSAEYVHNIIATAWKRKGWVGAGEHGLRKIEDCAEQSDHKWKLLNADAEHPPAWQSEKEFFQWIGLRYTDPQYREFKKTLNEAQ
jgi:DNA polymerase/3'-5' exonuclease PolX